MNPNIGALVLAAGFSNRYGSIKLCAELENGTTVYRQTLHRISSAIPNCLVVTRPELESVLQPDTIGELHVFDQAERGMGATLAFGISLVGHWEGALVCLADMPFIQTDTYRRVAALLDQDGIVVPTFDNMPGNPVAFGSRFFPELMALSGDSGGRPVLHAHAGVIQTIAVEDPAILADIDTPEDLSRYQSQLKD